MPTSGWCSKLPVTSALRVRHPLLTSEGTGNTQRDTNIHVDKNKYFLKKPRAIIRYEGLSMQGSKSKIIIENIKNSLVKEKFCK